MTIDEAIKLLTESPYRGVTVLGPEFQKATKLGIEALKFFKDLEDRGALPPDARLPGETKD